MGYLALWESSLSSSLFGGRACTVVINILMRAQLALCALLALMSGVDAKKKDKKEKITHKVGHRQIRPM